MTGAAVERRLAALEGEARRLLPKADPDDPLAWMRHLSSAELDRLAFVAEQMVEPGLIDAALEALWGELYRRAIGRALLGVDHVALDPQERQGQVIVRVGDQIVTYRRDLVDPDRWHLDVCYWQRSGLPREMSTAELEHYRPSPWPPRAGAPA
jgi:hypothetical protein